MKTTKATRCGFYIGEPVVTLPNGYPAIISGFDMCGGQVRVILKGNGYSTPLSGIAKLNEEEVAE